VISPSATMFKAQPNQQRKDNIGRSKSYVLNEYHGKLGHVEFFIASEA
jgi:hypothetical protein